MKNCCKKTHWFIKKIKDYSPGTSVSDDNYTRVDIVEGKLVVQDADIEYPELKLTYCPECGEKL